MVSQLDLPTEEELLEGEIKYVPEGEHLFDKNFKYQLVEVGDNDQDSWDVATFRRPSFIKDGLSILHHEFGRVGRQSVTSAAIMYGYRCYQDEHDDLFTNLRETYYENLKAQEEIIHSTLSVSPSTNHERAMTNNTQAAIVEPSLHGQIVDLADIFDKPKSYLYRHFAAVAISHSYEHGSLELGYIGNVAHEYERALDHAIRQMADYITEGDP